MQNKSIQIFDLMSNVVCCIENDGLDRQVLTCHQNAGKILTSKHAFIFFVCEIYSSCHKEFKNRMKVNDTWGFAPGHPMICPTYTDSPKMDLLTQHNF